MTQHRYGRYQVAEAPSSLFRLHIHDGVAPLRTVDHEPKVGVLDQQDLFAQGIDTSTLIPGAQSVNALGSCTANAGTSALSNILSEQEFLGTTQATSYADVKGAEEFAIRFYHQCTDQTGDPATEWPPTDCGSSGPFIVKEMEAMKLVSADRIAHGGTNIVSLLQRDGILAGAPFLKAWEEPDSSGFIDGDGSYLRLMEDIAKGVAGGHEIYFSAVEKLVMDGRQVDADKTVLRFRNSWSRSWGDNGSARFHLSTFVALSPYCDFRQVLPVAA